MKPKKFSLISEVDNVKSVQLEDKQKKKFQLFEVSMGIDKVDVLVPFENADEFEACLKSKKPSTRASLKNIAEAFEGILK